MATVGERAQEQDEGPPGCHLQQDEEDKEDTGPAHAGQVDEPDETQLSEEAADGGPHSLDGEWCMQQSGSLFGSEVDVTEDVQSDNNEHDSFHHPSDWNSHVPPPGPGGLYQEYYMDV